MLYVISTMWNKIKVVVKGVFVKLCFDLLKKEKCSLMHECFDFFYYYYLFLLENYSGYFQTKKPKCATFYNVYPCIIFLCVIYKPVWYTQGQYVLSLVVHVICTCIIISLNVTLNHTFNMSFQSFIQGIIQKYCCTSYNKLLLV